MSKKPAIVFFCNNDPIFTQKIDPKLSQLEAITFCGQINSALRNLGVFPRIEASVIRHEFPNGLFSNNAIDLERILKSRDDK